MKFFKGDKSLYDRGRSLTHLLNYEKYWTLKLRTVYSYGLNERVGDKCKNEETHQLVDKSFTPLNRMRHRVTGGQ